MNISPEEGFSHFSELLSKNVESQLNDDLECFIKEHLDETTPSINLPFSKADLIAGLKQLKNNKASSFEQISKEMLKTWGLILHEHLVTYCPLPAVKGGSFTPLIGETLLSPGN